MKASELRLRNYVTIFGIGGTIAQIVPNDFVKWVDDEWECNDLYPIPLTEEWLVKFGFLGQLKNGDYKNNRFIVWELPPLIFNTNHGWWVSNVILPIDILYVHQLQNLYFAITGEELTIK